MRKRILQCIAFLLLLPCLMGVGPDPGIRFTVSYQTDVPMRDVELRLYRVGDIVGDRVVLDEAYGPYDLAVDDEALLTLASTLQSYIRRDKIEAMHVALTDNHGRVEIDGLERAVYLVDGTDVRTDKGLYRIVPSLVYVDGDGCLIELKHEFVPIEAETVSRTVRKAWTRDSRGFQGPVVVDLLANGEVYDTFELNEENGWTKEVSGLDGSVLWSFVERTDGLMSLPDGYEWICRTSVDGDVTEIVNDVKVPVATPSPTPTITPSPDPVPTPLPVEPEDPPEPPGPVVTAPETGVANHDAMLFVILAACALAAVGAAAGINKCGRKSR